MAQKAQLEEAHLKLLNFICLVMALLGASACSDDDDGDFNTPRRETDGPTGLTPQNLTPPTNPYGGSSPVLVVGGTALQIANPPSGGRGSLEYKSTTPSICTAGKTSGAVSASRAGRCIVQARFAGNSNYRASNWVTLLSIDVGKGTQTPTVYTDPYGTSPTLAAGGSNLAIQRPPFGQGTVTYRATTNNCRVSSTTGAITPVSQGLCTIQARFAGNASYLASDWVDIFSINVGPRSVVTNGFNFTGTSHYLAATMSSRWVQDACPASYYTRPKVDFIILWDNLDKANYADSTTAVNALLSFVHKVSDQFDLRLAVAPLFLKSGEDVQWKMKVVANTPVGGTFPAADVIAVEKLPAALKDMDSGIQANQRSANERGIDRASKLVAYAKTNGVLRPESYLNVVVVSKGDDGDIAANIKAGVHSLLCYRGHYGEAIVDPSNNNELVKANETCVPALTETASAYPQMLRFHSVAYSSSCNITVSNYKLASRWIYNQRYVDSHGDDSDGVPGRFSPTDQGGRPAAQVDHHNACANNVSLLKAFDNIYYAAYSNIARHAYAYWPVVSSFVASFTAQDITRAYIEDGGTQRVISPSSENGYSFYTGTFTDAYLRATPPNYNQKFSGEVIQFHGSAKVYYPQCVKLELATGKEECFNAVALPSIPKDNTLKLYINGTQLMKTEGQQTNWELLEDNSNQIEFKASHNILANCGDGTTSSNEINRTGYILSITNGDKIYKSTDVVKVEYDVAYPSSD